MYIVLNNPNLLETTETPEQLEHNLEFGVSDDNQVRKLTAAINSATSSVGAGVLEQALNQGVLTSEHLAQLDAFQHELSALPFSQQLALGDQLAASVQSQLTASLADKSLTPSQVTQVKQTLAALPTITDYQATLRSGVSGVGANTPTPIVNGNSLDPIINSNANYIPFGDPSSIVLGTINGISPIGSSSWNLGSFNIFGANSSLKNLDLVAQAIIFLLGYVNTTAASALNELETNYNTMNNNIGSVTSLQDTLREVPQFMATNNGQIPSDGINPFIALDVAVNGVTQAAADSGLSQKDLQIYSQFVHQCPSFMAKFTQAYNQYRTANPNSESFANLIKGDGNYSGQNLTGQAQIMSYLAQDINAIGQGLGMTNDSPIFSSAWVNSGPNTLYTTSATTGAHQLMFTPNSVSVYFGSGAAADNVPNSALGVCSSLITNAATTNNQTHSMMSIIAQNVGGIWHMIGSNLIQDARIIINM
jgi:hypothetical protein